MKFLESGYVYGMFWKREGAAALLQLVEHLLMRDCQKTKDQVTRSIPRTVHFHIGNVNTLRTLADLQETDRYKEA